MSQDKELDEILESLKQKRSTINDLINEKPIDPPKPIEPTRAIEPPKPIAPPEPIAPPKPAIKDTKPEVKQKHEKAKPKDKPKKAKKERKPKDKQDRKNLSAIISPILAKIPRKAKMITAGVLAVALVITSVGVGIDYSKHGYLRKYEKEYGVEFPNGILEEYCDAYGTDQSIRGAIRIEDSSTYSYISSNTSYLFPYLSKGSVVEEEQQFRSITISTSLPSLEEIYSTSAGYLNSTQAIGFDTIYSKAEYHIIGAYYTNTVASQDNDYLFPYTMYGNMTPKSFVTIEDRLSSRFLYDTGYKFSYDDKFLSVNMNSSIMPDYKFVLVAIQVKQNTPSTTATDNQKVHYPQKWYDDNKKVNPYRFASKWYPEIYQDNEVVQLAEANF